MDTTASNFARAQSDASKEDIAAGIIIVLLIAVNLIIPAIFGFISVRRASRCEEPAKAVKIVRGADIVRLIFHTFLMIGAVILVITSEWEEKAKDLAGRFIKNFKKYEGNEAGKALVAAGPKL